ncbi:Cof-type HAD-IIB family hydrolase [Clostridium chromiireducens]|uniref:Cof-type HAD-IIB family hydrolase n=1 Tax=Clostridium chromiireducens TaxID=225345 RepID=A0A1V4IFR6_9CLOT|nr:Cof-type HAD-IIB family hydrolase [Clostridium chromiireducens]MVX64723.1 Cof-type HAD-IIB family hydrolase [Clostridium chromiireducens]OPJ58367.1 putative phosphatase YwpJ [Clostridium chromiireducens]RII36376.1 Cof-type HAD-IIB family hydrolase [Clostridium chromiireducens]
MIKLIASDMDGTLLNEKHKIDKETVEAIRKAEESGIVFAISTGREYDTVEPLLKENNIRCQCVLMNGAEYRDEDGNILEDINIELETATKIIGILQKEKVSARIFTNKGIYTTDTKEEALKEMVYRTLSFEPNLTYEEAEKIAKTQPYFVQLKYISNLDEFLKSGMEIRKFVAFHKDVELINKMKKVIGQIERIAVSSSFRDNIEVTHITAQKGIILAKVSEKMGFKRDEVLVLGDSFNDYSMFTEFTESVAMGNAIPEIKEIAKYITDTNDNLGVAKAIYRVLEEQK